MKLRTGLFVMVLAAASSPAFGSAAFADPAPISPSPSEIAPTGSASPTGSAPSTTAFPSARTPVAASPSVLGAITGTVTGVIRDVVTGKPIAGALIDLQQPPSPLTVTQTVTGPGGAYTLTAAPGTYRLVVLNSDPQQDWAYVNRRTDGPTPQSLAPTVVLTGGATVTLDSALTPAGQIDGVVVTTDGTPVSGVHVWASSKLGVENSVASYNTANDGTFRLHVGPDVAGPTQVRIMALVSGNGLQVIPPASGTCSGVARTGRIDACSELVTIAPEQVITGVRVVLVLATPTPTPTPTTTQTGNGLPKTGTDRALPTGAIGLLLLALGIVVLAIERKTRSHHH